MQTELLSVTSDTAQNRSEKIARAVELLKSGELVAFPTDTVYGVAAVPNRADAIAQLYLAKSRPPDKAIPILVAEVEDLEIVASGVSELVRQLVAHFWPGGLTLVLHKSVMVPAEVSATSSVAVRLPDLALARDIISAVGFPLAVTSANRSGQPSPRTALEVLTQLGGRISAVLDGGVSAGGVPSTILDCTTNPPRLLRAGAVPVASIRKFTRVRW